MQKLVTIYLDNSAYANADKHGLVEEHLQQELANGWRVVSVTGFGGSAQVMAVRGWLAVLLEKP